MPVGRRPTFALGADRDVLDDMTSRSRTVTYAPSIVSTGFGLAVVDGLSRIARSPRYARTVIASVSRPTRRLTKLPVYVPPRNQIVAPGWTSLRALSAVWRSQGFSSVPLPSELPSGAAKYSGGRCANKTVATRQTPTKTDANDAN